MSVYANDLTQALHIIDSAKVTGDLTTEWADLLRATVYGRTLDTPRLDSAIVIAERLLDCDEAMRLHHQRLPRLLPVGERTKPNTSSEAEGNHDVRAFNLNFGDTITGVTTPLSPWIGGGGEPFYTLDGRRLSSKATALGLYINKGKKVAIN